MITANDDIRSIIKEYWYLCSIKEPMKHWKGVITAKRPIKSGVEAVEYSIDAP